MCVGIVGADDAGSLTRCDRRYDSNEWRAVE